jgi:hypothetical protein
MRDCLSRARAAFAIGEYPRGKTTSFCCHDWREFSRVWLTRDSAARVERGVELDSGNFKARLVLQISRYAKASWPTLFIITRKRAR